MRKIRTLIATLLITVFTLGALNVSTAGASDLLHWRWGRDSLVVRDGFVGGVELRDRPEWRRLRNQVVATYAEGLHWTVTIRVVELNVAEECSWNDIPRESSAGYPAGTILLCRARDIPVDVGGWMQAFTKGGTAHRVAVALKSPRAGNTLCHELGHALGLGHGDDPGDSVVEEFDWDSCLDSGAGITPSDRDLLLLRGAFSGLTQDEILKTVHRSNAGQG